MGGGWVENLTTSERAKEGSLKHVLLPTRSLRRSVTVQTSSWQCTDRVHGPSELGTQNVRGHPRGLTKVFNKQARASATSSK